jgi:Ca2+-binding EF-hand superfamily protein
VKNKTLLLAALAAAVLASPSLAAQNNGLADEVNLFISPCGEPFVADKKDAYPIVKWFKRADANNDGKLDIDEMRNDASRFFAFLDRNHDGMIDGAEVTFYETQIAPEILTQSGALQTGIIKVDLQRGVDSITPGGSEPGDENVYRERLNSSQGAVFYSLFREPEPVRSADRNFDYRITLKEFQDHSDRHFKALDVDGKGFLTLADLPKTDAEKQTKAHR